MTQSTLIGTDLDEPEQRWLRILAGWMIPAAGGCPSAADGIVWTDIATTLAGQPALTRTGTDCLTTLLAKRQPADVTAWSEAEQLALVAALRSEAPAFVTLFEATVAACYYRDERVLRALGLPARAPFPEGHAVAPTDWSLLDPVRQRAPFYRKI